MRYFLTLFAVLLALAAGHHARAEPADIDAAARGVVRVVIIGTDGEELIPISHGTGFAVNGTTIVTNAHVVRDAMVDERLQIGIVPNGGGEGVYGRLLAISARNDLALVQLTGDMRLPPLTLSSSPPTSSGEVTSVGYPMNVDRAQGLDISDIFSSQPPVKSRGYISGERPSRQFDTILHTAPIARGNSGGPLLDACGRVVGVNSFGADNQGGDAEFFFAVSNRELIPFLRENDIAPRTNEMPCRSLADLDQAERERVEREQLEARQSMAQRAELTREQRERALLEAQMGVTQDRDDRMALAFLLVLLGFAAALWAWLRIDRIDPAAEDAAQRRKPAHIAFCIAAFLVIVALIAYFTRPGLAEIDRRVAAAMQDGAESGSDEADAAAGSDVALTCRLVPERSRVTSAQVDDVAFDWTTEGCVNERTQYGYASGNWSRVFVPNEEDAVSVNSFDPSRQVFRTERYLLSRGEMAQAREARSKYSAPQCGADGAGAEQSLRAAVLPCGDPFARRAPTLPGRLIFACFRLGPTESFSGP
ncbi:MAG: protease [Citromicrobium sp.]|nr:MAG: protease [Citromicrobium sp.]